jgi:protein TonB
MNASSGPQPVIGAVMGQTQHSRGALALAVAGHVIGALLLVKLLDIQRVAVTPPLIVEILQPEPEIRKKEEPLPKKKLPEPEVELPRPPEPEVELPRPPEPRVEKLRPPEPRLEQPPPPEQLVKPDVLPEPLPQEEMPLPPVIQPNQPIQQVRRVPVQDQVQPVPQPVPAAVPVVRRPVEPVQAPPPLAPPRDPVRETPAPPILTAKTPTPVQTVMEPPRVVERPLQAPEAPRVAPREPPRRPVPDAAPMMEIAEAPLPPDVDADAVEPPPLALPKPTGPAPVGPEVGLNAQMLTALYLRNPKPGYPAASRRLGEQGTVLLRVFVTVAGEAKRVELKTTSGYPRLDRAALGSVQNWKFVPARREDKPVDAWVLVPIKFSLNK